MAKEKTNLKYIPPCPDPERYVYVNRKDGGYWKRKRGTIKQAVLNDSFQQNSSAFKITSPVARRIKEKLEEFTRGLSISSLHSRLNGKLVKAYNKNEVIDFSLLKGFEIQEDHTLEKILLTQYRVQRTGQMIEIHVAIADGAVKKYKGLTTDFYFEGILLYGDALADRGLQTAYAVSKPYCFTDTVNDDCRLLLPLPVKNEHWILMLKVSCLEGNEMAAHPKHYGMRVVEVGVADP
jgi:hypothetical protein